MPTYPLLLVSRSSNLTFSSPCWTRIWHLARIDSHVENITGSISMRTPWQPNIIKITYDLMEATALHHSGELTRLTPSWCTYFYPIRAFWLPEFSNQFHFISLDSIRRGTLSTRIDDHTMAWPLHPINLVFVHLSISKSGSGGIPWRFELPAGPNSNLEPLLIWSAREVRVFPTPESSARHDKVTLRFHISHFTRQGDWDFTFGSVQSVENRHLYGWHTVSSTNCCTGDHSWWSLYRWYIFSTHCGLPEWRFTPWLGLPKE